MQMADCFSAHCFPHYVFRFSPSALFPLFRAPANFQVGAHDDMLRLEVAIDLIEQ